MLSMVWRLTELCGDIVVYCDTDSIKFIDHPKAEAIFREYNERKAQQLRELKLGADFDGLGFFDDEGTAVRAKFLGAKRYMVEDEHGHIEATVAGLPKSVIKTLDDPFESFKSSGFCLPAGKSDKLTTCYNDNYHGSFVEGEWMEEESSVALYEIPFSMMTDRDYYTMLLASPENRRKIIGQRVMG